MTYIFGLRQTVGIGHSQDPPTCACPGIWLVHTVVFNLRHEVLLSQSRAAAVQTEEGAKEDEKRTAESWSREAMLP